ncbi:spondin-1-like isoform X2 [Eriocheir sinensis]|uniref:spondin-1-like isoform X2 n=1 Tax=Eriocheir sinensis TaxID=95602 RepID=UPI0021C8A897|nr:spondin-1-like isoform X2 [Eriocheir sinensis]
MGWAWAVVVAVSVLGAACVNAQAASCNRAPLGTQAPRTPGSNNFTIKISGNPQKYVPGEVYTVSLQGWREQYSVKKFTFFLLLVEPSQVPLDVYGPQSVGIFQLYGDAFTMHSDDCPNAITQTSAIPKSEIQVLWTAPPANSGCVRFRATVVENRDVWYMDDGGLTKELCEEVQESPDVQPPIVSQCCACDEAKYEVTFEGLWSRHTHPKDFPNNEWLTHFSDIIGASHSADYMVWEYGKEASDGLKQVAEWGSTRTLESELKRQSDHIRTIIKARGLWHPNVNGKTFAVFRVDNRHHLMSLVSMLGPTPDWIVGVSALELCLANCSWVPHKTLNLYPYDAGTDSGVTYESANSPTYPKGKIRRITSSYPNDPASPFYDPTGKPMKPLARLTITRQRVYEKSCSDTDVCNQEKEVGPCRGYFPRYYYNSTQRRCLQFAYGGCRGNRNNFVQYDECSKLCEFNREGPTGPVAPPTPGPLDSRSLTIYTPQNPRVNCEMSDWSDWSPCNPICGRNSTKERRRTILVHPQNGGRKCRKLVRKKKCKRKRCNNANGNDQFNGLVALNQVRETEYAASTPAPLVPYQPATDPTHLYSYDHDADLLSPNLYNPYIGNVHLGTHDHHDGLPVSCVLSNWGPWSPCTVSCGPVALQQRSRLVVEEARNGGTACGDTTQRRYCKLPPCPHPRSELYPWP